MYSRWVRVEYLKINYRQFLFFYKYFVSYALGNQFARIIPHKLFISLINIKYRKKKSHNTITQNTLYILKYVLFQSRVDITHYNITIRTLV